MPPKIEGIQNSNHIHRQQPIVRKPVKPDVQPQEASGITSRRSEMNLYGSQQKNRLERF